MDDLEWFRANAHRKYRLRLSDELQTGPQRSWVIIDRTGRKHEFRAGRTFTPLDTDAEIGSLLSGLLKHDSRK